jgi:DNA-3-methyladenine glycosylase II
MKTDESTGGRPRPLSPRLAAAALAERDPVMARLVADAGPPSFPRPTETHFAALVRSVTHQQLAGAAAQAIHGRLVAALDGEVTAKRLLATPTDALRAAGLSGNKVLSLQDLAAKVLDGTVVLDPRRLGRETDEDVVARLTTVRGIGKWSAEIFLMFQLRRLDVWPTGDLGVRKGFALAWGIAPPTPKQLDLLGEPYHPYRSIVAWYCWRATQLYAGATPTSVTSRPRRKPSATRESPKTP